MSRYRVKFTDAHGKLYYGIVRSYDEEARAAAKRGIAIVDDAVLPVSYQIAESALVDIPYSAQSLGRINFKTGLIEGGDEYTQYVQEQFLLAQKKAKQVKGVQAGALFAIGAGDGYAWYVVTKATKKRATVEWRGFCEDRWHDHFFGSGRTLAIADVEPYVRRGQALDEIFG